MQVGDWRRIQPNQSLRRLGLQVRAKPSLSSLWPTVRWLPATLSMKRLRPLLRMRNAIERRDKLFELV